MCICVRAFLARVCLFAAAVIPRALPPGSTALPTYDLAVRCSLLFWLTFLLLCVCLSFNPSFPRGPFPSELCGSPLSGYVLFPTTIAPPAPFAHPRRNGQ